MTANCDVQLYNDPTMPGCSEGPDGVEGADESVETCTSAIELQITTTDASVHITRRFEVPIFDTVGSGRRALQRVGDAGSASRIARKARVEEKSAEVFALVDMFRTDQQAGLAFPTEVIEFNCDTDAHAGRPICQQHGLMPIVEPDVVMDGGHGLGTSARVTKRVLATTFRALDAHGVDLARCQQCCKRALLIIAQRVQRVS